MNWNRVKNISSVVSDRIRLMCSKLDDGDFIMHRKRYAYATVIADHKVDEFTQGLKR